MAKKSKANRIEGQVRCPTCGERCGYIVVCANCGHGKMDGFDCTDIEEKPVITIGKFQIYHRTLKPLTGEEPV